MYIKERIKTAAFTSLVFDNSSKKKTKNILYSEFEMKEYLKDFTDTLQYLAIRGDIVQLFFIKDQKRKL